MSARLVVKPHLDPCGLKNKGNTCFFNASIQCLLSLPRIHRYFKDTVFDPVKQPFCLAFQSFIFEYNNTRILDPSDFLARIRGKIRLFDGRQQDAHAFLESFIARLSDELDSMDATKGSHNVIKKTLGISIEDKVTCERCGFVSTVSTVGTMQYLTIKERVQRSLDFYLNNEDRVDQDSPWKCTECGVKSACPIVHSIKATSDYFIVYLNRFQSLVSKNTSPIALDYSIHINGKAYELVGIVCHSGVLAAGHYFAYCKRGEGWFEYSDSTVTPADLKESTNSAYILFYSRT